MYIDAIVCAGVVMAAANRHGAVPFIFGLLGVGVLVPWNAFISAKPYFSSRFCDDGRDRENFESTFAMIYNLSSVGSLSLMLLSQWLREILLKNWMVPAVAPSTGELDDSRPHARTNSADQENASESKVVTYWQVMVPLGIFLLVFASQAILVMIPAIQARSFWQVTILGLAACGFVTSVASAGIVHVASSWRMVEYFLAGQSFGGVAVALTNWVAALWNDPADFHDSHCKPSAGIMSNDHTADNTRDLSQRHLEECVPYNRPDFGVMVYFGLGALVMVACLVGYSHVVLNLDPNEDYESIRSVVSNSSNTARGNVSLQESATADIRSGMVEEIHESGDCVEQAPPEITIPTDDAVADPTTTMAVWGRVWAPGTCIFLTFVVTLGLFPGWTSSLVSVYSCRSKFRLTNDLYVPTTFLVFNVFDLAGRMLSSKVEWCRIRDAPRKLVGASLLRLLLIPILYTCPSSFATHWPYVPSDLYSWVVQCIFGLSNGFLVTSSFVIAPTLLVETTDRSRGQKQQARSSTLLTLSLSFGLLAGSLLSYPIIQMGRL